MKTTYGVALAAICGAVAGASMVSALQAQPPDAPAYFIANIQQVTDAALYARYRAAAPRTEEPFGGHVVARGAPIMLDSSQPPAGTVTVIQFPSVKALMGWWNSPAYASIRPMREQATVSRAYAVAGLPAP